MKNWLSAALLGIVCGSTPTATAQEIAPTQVLLPIKPPENEVFGRLNGNWKLSGDREQGIFPMLSVNIATDGNQILADCPLRDRLFRAKPWALWFRRRACWKARIGR